MTTLNWLEPYVVFQDSIDNTYYSTIIVDGLKIPIDYVPLERALELLIKVYYVFNLKYVSSFAKFFEFFDVFVLKIKNNNPSAAIFKFHKYLK